MIDEKTLEQWELAALDADHDSYAEVFRNARRYLALREEGVIIQLHSEDWLFAGKLDAAADRLMEGGE